jgi:flagellar motility protein MotE (MotC chaperone)
MNFLYILILIILTVNPCHFVFAAESNSAKEELQYRSVEERRLFLALQQERDTLALERKKLDEKQKELKIIEIEVDKKLNQLKALRQQIETLIAAKDKEETKKIQELSKMYDKMTSAKAARILSSLEQDLAVSILENMKTNSAAKILDNMDKDKAASLTDAFSNLDIQ